MSEINVQRIVLLVIFFWSFASLWYQVFLLMRNYYKILAIDKKRNYEGFISEWSNAGMHNAIAAIPAPIFWIENMDHDQKVLAKKRLKYIAGFWGIFVWLILFVFYFDEYI